MGLVVIAAIALGVGVAASPRQQTTPAASTAQQATLPGDAASRRLRNEIAGIEGLLPQFVDRGAALTCWPTITRGSAIRKRPLRY